MLIFLPYVLWSCQLRDSCIWKRKPVGRVMILHALLEARGFLTADCAHETGVLETMNWAMLNHKSLWNCFHQSLSSSLFLKQYVQICWVFFKKNPKLFY